MSSDNWQPIEALRQLGGRATAMDIKSKMTCPHCGPGLNERAAELSLARAIEAGQITVQRDWSLKLAESTQ